MKLAREDKLVLSWTAAICVVVVVGFCGWCSNLLHLFRDHGMSTGEIVVRAIGIPAAPVGALIGILGWF
jgi:hypothetical protein